MEFNSFIDEIIKKDLESGKVKSIITRFPPEPNGYLHIGHAKSICLNYFSTAVRYGGVCNLRFDDTNPTTENDEFVNSIIADVEWLGWKGDIFYASDYFQEMYDCAVRLIKKGLAYIDDLSPEEIRQTRGTLTQKGTPSPNRDRAIEENLRLFEEMRSGRVEDGKLILRAKIDMDSPNMNMRDPVIYRVLHAHHHRQKDKWCIYPMYDFAHPIEDAVEHITHSICTLEFEDHRPLYDWVIKHGEFSPAPHQYEFARLNLSRTIMSKRYLKRLVDDGVVDGWDDPRMPTIAGLRRRGVTPTAIRNFCEKIGVAKANSEVDRAFLDFCVREELNTASERVMALLDPIKLTILNVDEGHSEECEIDTGRCDGSKRTVSFSRNLLIEREDFAVNPPPKYHRLFVGGKVRLRGAYIVECVDFVTDSDGRVVEVLANLITNSKSGCDCGIKCKGVIHWLNAKNAVDAEIYHFDDLLLDDDGTKQDFSQRLNKASRQAYAGKIEPYLAAMDRGQRVQFVRQGYYCFDSKSSGLVFNRIVGLKDTFKPI